MKAFRFRLQAVLTLREQAEQAAQQRCAAAYAAVEAATAQLRSADDAITAHDQMQRSLLNSGARASELEQAGAYALVLKERWVALARKLAEAQQQAEKAWQELLVATQRRETLERLRARQRRAHDYLAGCAEQKLLDEMAGRPPTLLESWRQTALTAG